MFTKSRFPKKISSMIATARQKGMTSAQIASRINDSATAKNLKVEYTARQIAAHMAWLTMKEEM